MMTSSNGNIFRVPGPLCGEFTGPGEFPTQRPVTRSFGVFFDLRLNKRLSKQPWGWWFEMISWSLWRHCNVMPLPYFHRQLNWYIGRTDIINFSMHFFFKLWGWIISNFKWNINKTRWFVFYLIILNHGIFRYEKHRYVWYLLTINTQCLHLSGKTKR